MKIENRQELISSNELYLFTLQLCSPNFPNKDFEETEVRATGRLTYLLSWMIHCLLVTNFQSLPPTSLIFGQFQLIIKTCIVRGPWCLEAEMKLQQNDPVSSILKEKSKLAY